MSYILEALRKADAERERGAVPDLNSQLLPDAPPGDETQERRAPRWLWTVLIAALVLGGVWAGSWLRGQAAPEVAVAPAPPPSMPAAAAPAPPVPVMAPVAAADAVAAAPAAPASIAAPAAAPVEPPAQANAPPTAPAPAPFAAPAVAARAGSAPTLAQAAQKPSLAPGSALPKAKPVPQSGPPEQARVANAAKAPPGSEEKALPKADAQPPPPHLPRLNELPDELRQQMPALAVGGSVYSPQPEKRMIILNGQVFLEGAVLAPELKLEQIRPRSAVLSIRGQQFELPL